MAASTAMAVKGELYDRLTARLPLVAVAWDRPDEHTPQEIIHLGDITQDEEWAALGARSKQESYAIAVRVICEAWFGNDPRPLQERSAALWDEIAAELRDHPSLDCLPGLIVAATEGFSMTAPSNANPEDATDPWRQAVVDGRIRVIARI